MNITFLNLFILLSALWRLSNLFANEEGPFLIFFRIRIKARRLTKHNRFLRKARFAKGLECEWCNSIWFGSLLTLLWWWVGDVVVLVMLPLAFSTWVVFQKYLLHLIRNAEEYYHKLNEKPSWLGGVDFASGKDKSSYIIYRKEW